MPHLCTNCGINWARLKTIDEGQDGYDVCPECYTDNYLEESEDPDTYIKYPLNGKVISVKTKKEREGTHFEPPADPKFYKYKKRKYLSIPKRNV